MRTDTRRLGDGEVPRAAVPILQHVVDTYASETNKTAAVWQRFDDGDLAFAPHERSSPVEAVLRHQLLSERRFFAEFLGLDEPPADQVVPAPLRIGAATDRLVGLARPRLAALAAQPASWWERTVPFFDVERQRIWIFWRRVLHTAHHRTQLTVYLRLLGRPAPAVYGPSADETWLGADPTTTAAAAGRGGGARDRRL
ncbi:MAG: DinB family protein [Acidobacteriota bacterium]